MMVVWGTRFLVRRWSGKTCRKWVWLLVWEDPTCHRVTMPTHHDYWAHALGPVEPQPAEPRHLRACTLQLLKPEHLEPVLCNDRHHHSEKPMHPCPPRPEKAMRRHEDPVQPKLKINKSFQIKRQGRWYPHLTILRGSKQTGNWEIPAQWKKNPLSQYTVSKQLGLESRFHSVFSITCYSKIGI